MIGDDVAIVYVVLGVVAAAGLGLDLIATVIVDDPGVGELLLDDLLLEGASIPDAGDDLVVFVLELLDLVFEVLEFTREIGPLVPAHHQLLFPFIIEHTQIQ